MLRRRKKRPMPMSTLKNQAVGEGEDRLSSLPDNLLVTILSLLPIESAAATSVLSRRWPHLWTHLTHISLPPPIKHTSNKFHYFLTVINDILLQLTSPIIHTFELFVSEYYEMESTSAFLIPWINQICFRNPEILWPLWVSSGRFYSKRFFQQPSCLFECRSLVNLRLEAFFDFKFNDDGIFINLPKLKKLHLYLNDSHRLLMATLVKSCPLLQELDLYLHFQDDDHFVDISAPNLKRLFIRIKTSCWSVNNHKVVIDSPKLDKFDMCGPLVFLNFVEIPSSLQEVQITPDELYVAGKNGYVSKIKGLIWRDSFVESMILKDWDFPMLSLLSELDAIALPIFQNLSELTIDLDYEDQRPWYEYPHLPLCLLGNLEWLEIKNLMGNDLDIKMLQHVLTNATVLEQLHVSVCYHDCDDIENDPLRKEHEFCKKLFRLPKSSLSCQIEFSGEVITASSKHFKNLILACRLKIDVSQYDSDF